MVLAIHEAGKAGKQQLACNFLGEPLHDFSLDPNGLKLGTEGGGGCKRRCLCANSLLKQTKTPTKMNHNDDDEQKELSLACEADP